MAITHYYPFTIRRLFPLLKDTTRATNKISMKQNFKHSTAFSDMSAWTMDINENDMKLTHFENTPSMPDNMIAEGVVYLESTLERNQGARL